MISSNRPTIHHPDPQMQETYNHYIYEKMHGRFNPDPEPGVEKHRFFDRDLPRIDRLENGRFIIYKADPRAMHIVTQSAWNDERHVENIGPTSGWLKPSIKNKNKIVLTGDYVALNTWFHGNYGHTLHDFLPYLAWLIHIFPDKKFIILNIPLYKNLIKFIDQELYNRVTWIEYDQIVQVQGELIVTTPDRHPCIMQHNLIDHFINWVQPLPVSKNTRDVIYYDRGTESEHGRVLHEKCRSEVLQLIKKKMCEHNVPGELILFCGTIDGEHVPFDEQFNIFRNAHTIIGPHGTGLANMMWSDFNKPVKVLEFIPGPHGYSSQVQAPFNDYWHILSGLPIEWHSVIYERESTHLETYLNIDHVTTALDKIWSSGV